jgi:DNA-binding response OmpR family regulator
MHLDGNVTGSAFFRMGEPPPISVSANEQTASIKNPILICSRDFDTQVLLKTILELWGFPSQISDFTGQTDMIINAAKPGLILLDSILPFSAHLENIRQIRRSAPARKTPIIVISGFSQSSFRNLSLEAGANHFLVKPLDFDLLEHYLNKFSGSRKE